MKNINEIRDYLLENRIDKNGDLDLKGLDFGDFNGNVNFSSIKVKNTLYQDSQEVGGYLFQGHQTVGKKLYQGHQTVGDDLYQNNQKCDGDLVQGHQQVKNSLFQTKQKFGKGLFTQDITNLIKNKNNNDGIYYTNIKKEITLEELKQMGYVLKENK